MCSEHFSPGFRRPIDCGGTHEARFSTANLGFNATKPCLAGFVHFGVIFGNVWEEIVFLKGLVKFGEIRNIKTESTRKSSNIYLSWTKIEYQNNLNPITLFSTLNKR